MTLNKTDALILSKLTQAYGPQTVSELYSAMPDGLFANKRALSSRLCEMRTRNLLTSKTLDSGINEWLASVEGLNGLKAQIADSQDISADIPDPIAADFAAALEADEEIGITDLPEFIPEPNQPVCAALVNDIVPRDARDTSPEWPDVSEDLVEEASSLFLATPFPRLHDALYVLHILAEFLKDRPTMAYELERVAAYLVEETP